MQDVLSQWVSQHARWAWQPAALTQDATLYDVCTPIFRSFNFCYGSIAALDECLTTNHSISMTQHDDTSVGVGVEAKCDQPWPTLRKHEDLLPWNNGSRLEWVGVSFLLAQFNQSMVRLNTDLFLHFLKIL